jgi:solute:Na+ symporter, SSS family
MALIDWIILFVYALSTIGMGWWVGRRQSSTGEYFTGSGKMNPVLVGVSLFATLLSTITYLAIPGEVSGKGPAYLANYLAYPFVFVVVTGVLLPVYMKHKVTSAYELLEERLGLSIRLLGVTMFLALRLVWMALLVYLTSKALVVVMGVDEKYVPLVVVITGIFAVTYTSVGGLRAVVVTDLMQTLLLYGGALLVIGTVTYKMGGLGWFPTEWQGEVWDHQPLFSWDPSVRVTLVGSVMTVFLWMVATAAGDQVSVQRFMATEDVAAARRAVAIQLTVGAVVGLTLGVVGVALLGFFGAHPEYLPEGKTLAQAGDQIFPIFIADHLPPVVTGLVIAGLFAAAMSSIDSGVNSITAVVMTDLLGRFGRKPETDAGQVRFSRWLAFGIGVTVVLLSSVVGRIPGNFMAITNKTVNLLSVPIALLFVFALFVPSASTVGVWIGAVASVGAAVLVAFSGAIFGVDPVTGWDPISFQHIPLVSLVVGLGAGWVGSRLFPRKDNS